MNDERKYVVHVPPEIHQHLRSVYWRSKRWVFFVLGFVVALLVILGILAALRSRMVNRYQFAWYKDIQSCPEVGLICGTSWGVLDTRTSRILVREFRVTFDVNTRKSQEITSFYVVNPEHADKRDVWPPRTIEGKGPIPPEFR